MTIKDTEMTRSESQEALTAPRLLTVPEAAERMNVQVRFVRHLISERRLPFTKLGRLVRISEADIHAFLEENRVEAER